MYIQFNNKWLRVKLKHTVCWPFCHKWGKWRIYTDCQSKSYNYYRYCKKCNAKQKAYPIGDK